MSIVNYSLDSKYFMYERNEIVCRHCGGTFVAMIFLKKKSNLFPLFGFETLFQRQIEGREKHHSLQISR